jgi:hypothetical protein
MEWKIPKEYAKRVLEILENKEMPSYEKGRLLSGIDWDIINACFVAHTGKTFSQLEMEDPVKTIPISEHCSIEHGTGFMAEIEHFGEDRPKKAWETAESILKAWAKTKLEEW